MAQSRLEKIGTIYSRTKVLLEKGIKDSKPIWYDIYESFPPKYEPRWDRQPTFSTDRHDRRILYEEDFIRAKFYREFPDTQSYNLFNNDKSKAQTFVEKYRELAGGYHVDEECFKKTVQVLNIQIPTSQSQNEEIDVELAPKPKGRADRSRRTLLGQESVKDLFLESKD